VVQRDELADRRLRCCCELVGERACRGGHHADCDRGADITQIATGASNDFSLAGLGSISKIGLTGLRLSISGGQPTADNFVQFAAWDHATLPEAQLIVTYTP